jgi:WD40 repeat protein
MMRRILGLTVACSLATLLAACDNSKPSGPAAKPTNGEAGVAAVTEIGDLLYPEQLVQQVPVPVPAFKVGADPIIVRQCQVSLHQTQNVPSKNDGRLLFFCTEVTDEEAKTLKPEKLYLHPSPSNPNVKMRYRILEEGDTVLPGQMIALVDDEKAQADLEIGDAKVEAKVAAKEAADQLLKASEEEYQMNVELKRKNAASESDVRRAKAQRDKAIADVADAKGQIKQSEKELLKARIVLNEHKVRTTIGGVLKRFYRKPGESIKQLDPVAEVQNKDHYRLEGLLEAQLLTGRAQTGVRKNLKVLVETAPLTGPSREIVAAHLAPVRAVAVSKDPRKPLIVSGGEDRTARAWDRMTMEQVGLFPHNLPVRAVACSPTENICVTGADDGVARLWDLDNPTAGKPLREMAERHQNRIISAAFAPDGKTCATADDREIILWDVADGKLRYRFVVQHKAPITSIQFTPQSRLVSEARDRSLCVWKLGQQGAAPETMIENRSGDVAVLGVSPDGQRVLFDQERRLLVLNLNANNQRNEGNLPSPSEASQFTSFAQYSPDGRLVLAGGTGDMPLQLWKAPVAGGQGSLIRRFAATGMTQAPTCAAFAPNGSFAVTGTQQDGRVLVWEMPDKAEIDRQLVCDLSNIELSINVAEKKARFWADFTNADPNFHLFEGDTVTLVVPRPEER